MKRSTRKPPGFRLFHRMRRGTDLFHDLRTSLPAFRADVVFDAWGANAGQSARDYLRHFPAAKIHCFEPVAATFETLRAVVGRSPRVTCHRLALAESAGIGRMHMPDRSERARLVPQAGSPPEAQEVAITTLDAFCTEQSIGHIDFLKIDTEGTDLRVLQGAGGLLSRQAIDLVEVEAGVNPANETHVPLELLKGHLEGHGYLLFGIYDQFSQLYFTREPHLRRVNAVFISGASSKLNIAPPKR